jgi:uncharacterized protein (TIGR02466 family)
VQARSDDISTGFREHLAMTFATPLVTYPWPDSERLNQELKAVILDNEKKSEGVVKSNVGGWHSNLGIFSWDAACIKALQGRVHKAAVECTRNMIVRRNMKFRVRYRIDGWANVVRSGDYHSPHNHPNNLWSGVYYISVGEPEPEPPKNGQLELLDPRLGSNMVGIPDSLFEVRYSIPTKAGLMVLFPSWLIHHVHPFIGNGERISIAFNILATNFRFVDEDDG